MHDAKKVQESTLAKWEKMEKGKAMIFKREVIEQKRNDEINDWWTSDSDLNELLARVVSWLIYTDEM